MLPDLLPRAPKPAPPGRFHGPEFEQPKDAKAKAKEESKPK
jgi:hypothetical protein